MLIKDNERNVLIDTGYGSHFTEKYGIDKTMQLFNEVAIGDLWSELLAPHELTPETITHVILTHGHLSHAGGAVTLATEGFVPSFKNAVHYLQKTNYDNVLDPHARETANYDAKNVMPLSGKIKLCLLEGSQEDLLPGISVYVSNGHTTGLQVVKISSQCETLLCCSDLIPTAAHIPLLWTSPDDNDPQELWEEKAQVLERASAEHWLLYFSHDVRIDAATVATVKNDFAIKESFSFL